jgi:hypothetical protein
MNIISENKYLNRILTLLLIALCFAPVIGLFFRFYIRHYNGFLVSISIILPLGGIVLLMTSMSYRIRLSNLFWLSFTFFVISVLVKAYIFNENPLAISNFYSNLDFLLVLMVLMIDNANISKISYDRMISYIYIIFYVSIAVILYQQLVNPLFLLIRRGGQVVNEAFVATIQYRNQSIFGLVGSESVGYTFNALYAILLNDSFRKNKDMKALILFCLGFTFSFLARSRYIIVFFLIVSLQFVFRYKMKAIRQLVFITFSLVILLIGLNAIGVPVEETIRIRYLDQDKGGITEGSWKSREDNYRVFNKFMSSSETILTGVYFSDTSSEYFHALGRKLDTNLIGVISPLVTYGLLGSLPFYLFYLTLLWQLYYFGRKTKNYAYFFTILGLIACAASIGNFSLIDMGFLIMLILYNFERRALAMNQSTNVTQAQTTKTLNKMN